MDLPIRSAAVYSLEVGELDLGALALESNRKIGMAIGILMAQYKLSEHQAFDLLRTASQHNHVKLRELAEQVVLTGEAAGWPTARRRPA